ncbi:MAG: hypothetical protein ABIU54_06690 [Candidatus Eisenbacteria bacterium]
MKRLLLVACLFALASSATVASADSMDAKHAKGGLGFHNVEAPIGLRWWMAGEKMAIDLGLGFDSSPSAIDADEKENGFAVEFGIPFVMHSWENAHVLFRPGLLYQSQQVGFDSDPGAGFTFDTENQTAFSVSAEIEAEIFLRENFSVSASHGIAFQSVDPGFGADSQTSFGTFGNNFTNIGFHVYFLGGE